ncbi:MAG TPA: YvrJ family protein [Thermosynergistes sp.]|nr:YvrJ family protein [Thermosynergistes sp.]HQE22116.1 YvrJ family protein [Thermosynergistes sp.]
MADFVSAALQGGFAVAVAAYLLVRMEKRIDDLTSAINELKQSIEESSKEWE